MYILFAALAMVSSVGNTILNRISSHKIGSVLSATIKAFMMTFACFIICLCFGNLKVIYALNGKQWMLLVILGLVTVVDWLFYFLALKRSYLEAFSCFEASTILFSSNLLFSIFMTESATVGGSTRNIILVVLGLVFVLASMVYAVFNKKINPIAKKSWVLFSIISAFSLAATLVIATKIKATGVPSDVVAFHQMSVVFGVFLIILLFSKEKFEIKKLNGRITLDFFISAIFNAMMMVFRYIALGYENSNQSVVNIIVGLDFVFVSIATVLFFKADNKKEITILILLVVAGMILNALPALL